MLTTAAICLTTVKYGDKSLISKVLCEQKGLLSIISSNGSSKKSRKNNYLQPLNLLEVVVYYKSKSTIHRLKEVKFSNPNSIGNKPQLLSIKLFLAEVLSKLIQENQENAALFDFIKEKTNQLEEGSINPNFHLIFLLELSQKLGVFPQVKSEGEYFDLQNGEFSFHKTNCCLDKTQSASLKNFFHEKHLIREERQMVLKGLLSYYEQQYGIGEVKSLQVLESVFNA